MRVNVNLYHLTSHFFRGFELKMLILTKLYETKPLSLDHLLLIVSRFGLVIIVSISNSVIVFTINGKYHYHSH